MTIPADATQVSVGTDGTVSALQPGNTEMTQVGRIELANFINPAGLHSMGDNLYLPTGSSGEVVVGTAGLDGLAVDHGLVGVDPADEADPPPARPHSMTPLNGFFSGRRSL